MPKLYTRSGDDGTTGLFGGDRVGKDHPRIEAFGTVDELNAWLGMAAAACAGGEVQARFAGLLADLQSRLFDLGADLATPKESEHRGRIAALTQEHVSALEALIDEVDSGNEPMRNFVLPGGTELAARLHAARTVCRRAERRLVAIARIAEISPAAVKWINRLGDLLFAMARRANADAGVADVPWKKQGTP